MNEEERLEYVVRAKRSMREYLRSKSWEEKVAAIVRMNARDKEAKRSMRAALAAEAEGRKDASSGG